MRTEETMQKSKLVAPMPCPHFMVWQVLRCFFNLGPRALEMLRAPRYLIPALPNNALMQHLLGARLNEREALGKVVTARPPKRLQMLSFQLCRSTGQKRQN